MILVIGAKARRFHYDKDILDACNFQLKKLRLSGISIRPNSTQNCVPDGCTNYLQMKNPSSSTTTAHCEKVFGYDSLQSRSTSARTYSLTLGQDKPIRTGQDEHKRVGMIAWDFDFVAPLRVGDKPVRLRVYID
jgi:hypothetical protein